MNGSFLIPRFTKWPCEEGRYLGYFGVVGEAPREDWLQIHRAMGLSSFGGYVKTSGKRAFELILKSLGRRISIDNEHQNVQEIT